MIKSKRNRIVAIISFCLIGPQGGANETDNFSRRWDDPPLANAGPSLDAQVNLRLQKVIEKYNSPTRQTLSRLMKQTKPCDSERLESLLAEELKSEHLLGAIELNLELSSHQKNPKTSKDTGLEAHRPTDQNIYRHPDYGKNPNVKSEYFASAATYKIPLASSINLHGHYIGTDKVGHFFDQGWSFFNEYRQESDDSRKTRRAFGDMLASEQGTYGLAGTGIYSFADLSANLSGGLFWMAATEFEFGKEPTFLKNSPWATQLWAKGPLFRCDKGVLSLRRPFAWKDYVTDAWDEGINCVDFNPLYDKGANAHPQLFLRNLKSLQTQNPGKHFECPVSPEKCTNLRSLYGSFISSRLLSSECAGRKKYPHRFELKQEACWFARHYKTKLADFKCSDIPENQDAPSLDANQ